MKNLTMTMALLLALSMLQTGQAQTYSNGRVVSCGYAQPINGYVQQQAVTYPTASTTGQVNWTSSQVIQPQVYSQAVYQQPINAAPIYGASQIQTVSYSQPVQPVYSSTAVYNSAPIASAPMTSAPMTSAPIPAYPATSYSSYSASYPTTSIPTSTYTYASSTPIVNRTYPSASSGTFATYRSANASTIPSYTRTSATGPVRSGLAQMKAQRMAQMNLRGHLGGGLGGARYEGVGWSNVSPQHAIQKCCYWGQRVPAQIGVSKGSDGCWYACVLYN